MANGSGVALVTGASQGLGEVVAKRLAREGYTVGLVARRAPELERVAREIGQAGGRAEPVVCDLTEAAAVARVFAGAIERLGAPEVLVNSAGTFLLKPFLETTPEEMRRQLDVNYLGAAYAARAVLPAMLAQGRGAILNISATAAWRGAAEAAAFAASKFALRALTQSLSREFGEQGIHVAQVVIDGQIDSPRLRALYPDRDRGSYVQPEAIAAALLFLMRQPRSAWTRELDLRPFDEERRS